MSGMIESLAFDQTILQAQDAGESLANGALYFCAPMPFAKLKPLPAKKVWSSSLGEHDLQCLLQVIEGHLIPQLLNSYSPARYAPRDLFESS